MRLRACPGSWQLAIAKPRLITAVATFARAKMRAEVYGRDRTCIPLVKPAIQPAIRPSSSIHIQERVKTLRNCNQLTAENLSCPARALGLDDHSDEFSRLRNCA